MAFNSNVELVNQLIQTVADAAPSQWTKVAFYLEFLEDEETGLRNKSTARCYGGANYDEALDAYSLGSSGHIFTVCRSLYRESAKTGDIWKGVLLVLLDNGRFKIRFFYEDTPLLNNDRAAVNERIAAGLKELP